LALFVPISLALVPSLRAADGSWTADASGNWTTTTNWSGNITANGTSATANFTNNITAARTVTLNATQTVGILNIGDTNQSHGFTFNASTTTPLVMDNGGSNAQVNFVSTSGANTLSVPLQLSSSLDINNSSNQTQTFSGNGSISSFTAGAKTITNNGTGTGGVVFGISTNPNYLGIANGTGTVSLRQNSATSNLTIYGNNTFSGNTTLDAGTLIVAGNNPLGSTGALILNSGTLSSSGGSSVQLNNPSVMINGDISLNSNGDLKLKASTLTGNRIFTVTSQAANVIFNGAIGQSGGNFSLTKNGTGRLQLSAANTFTGGIIINDGTLIAGNNGAFSTGGVTLNNGTLDAFIFAPSNFGLLTVNGGNVTASSGYISTSGYAFSGGDISAQLRGSGNLTKTGVGTTTLSGNSSNSSYTGITTISGGTLSVTTLANGSGNSSIGSSNSSASNLVLGGGTLSYTGANVTTDRGFTISNGTTGAIEVTTAATTLTISGNSAATTGSFSKSGNGTLLLSGNHSYTGATTVNAGTLATSAANRISDSSAVTVNAGGTFALGGAETVASIAGAGSYALSSYALTVGGGNGTTDVSGVISGSGGSLVKTGTGTLTLSGANTYNGSTTLSAGTLALNNSAALGGGGNITFSGGTLQFTANGTTDYSSQIKNSGSAIVLDTNGQSVTFANAVDSSNTNGLTKAGSGTLIITGTSTYTGTTTISAGTISVGNGGAAGALSAGNVSVSTGASLVLNRSDSHTVSNNLSGQGSLVNSGLGVTTLSGTNANNGTVSATAGTLLFSGASALSANTSLLSASGATLSLADGTTRNSTIAGTLSLNASNFVFDLNGSASDRLAVTGAATLVGTNTVKLNLSGSAIASSWTLLTAASGLNGTWSLDSSSFSAPGYAFSLSANGTTLTLSSALSSSNYYWKGGTSANWTVANNWTSDSAGNNASASIPSSASDLYFSATGASNLSTTLGQDFTINTLSISDAGGVAINSGNTITANATSSTAYSITAASGTTTINAALAGTGAGLTKNGGGTLILGGSNTYAGGTQLLGGTLQITSSASLGNASNSLTINPGVGTTATLQSGADNITLPATQSIALSSGTAAFDTQSYNLSLAGAISGTGALQKTGSGTLTLSGNNTYSGLTTISAGTLAVTGGNAIVNTGTVSLANSAGVTFLVSANEQIGALQGGGSSGGTASIPHHLQQLIFQ
jgi:autotransporter-associated beta strand protein